MRVLGVDPGLQVTGYGLINAVVDYLEDKVMEPAVIRAADIHTGPSANRL